MFNKLALQIKDLLKKIAEKTHSLFLKYSKKNIQEKQSGKQKSHGPYIKEQSAIRKSQELHIKEQSTIRKSQELHIKEQYAIRQFQELYTGNQRTNREKWLDYFTSDEFLDVYQKQKFVSMLLDTIKEYIEEFPLNKEFLKILYAAYGLYNNYEDALSEKNNIDKYIAEIAKMGPKISRFNANDLLIVYGFDDYCELLYLKQDNWTNDPSFKFFKNIIGHYQLHNISDIPLQHNTKYKSDIRHPKTIRLITYFFANTEVPEQAYRILWNRLCLETATSGRNKLLYGRLREIVLGHMTELSNKQKINTKAVISAFQKLNMEDNKNIDDFFGQKDTSLALIDETFVYEHVQYWVNDLCSRYFVQKLEMFYTTHTDAPYRILILKNINLWKKQEKINTEFKEDENSEIIFGKFNLHQRAYLRYFLNTAFHEIYGIKTCGSLAGYLYNNMPYSDKWSKKFIEESGFSAECPMQIDLGDNTLTIIFHHRFIEYLWNGSPCVPHLQWEEIINFNDETEFFMLLPITEAPFSKYSTVYDMLLSHLKNLPIDSEDTVVISDCIASKICQNEAKDDNTIVYTFYAETEELLYVCKIFKNNTISLSQIKNYNTVSLPYSKYYAPNIVTAVKMGLRLLNEYTASCPADCSIKKIPDRLSIKYNLQPPEYFEKKEITNKTLNAAMEQYFSQKAVRIEMSWKTTDLIFINDKNKYACLCFDNKAHYWYAFVALPEIYTTVDCNDVVYIPFGLGMLPDYLVHQNQNLIKQNLNNIFTTVLNIDERTQSVITMWSPHVYSYGANIKYNLAKRLYGGYPEDRVHNRITERFCISETPNCISYTDLENDHFENAPCRKNLAEDILVRYMFGKLLNLTLTWQYKETNQHGETIDQKRHIKLIQDSDNHQMLYIDDVTGSTYYLVSNVDEYINAEGKNYNKISFLGKSVPGYLVHQNLQRIRNYLDLLLSQIKSPNAILDIFGEFSYKGKE